MKKLIVLFAFICIHAYSISPATITEFIKIDQFGYKPNDQKIAVISNPINGYNNSLSFTPGTTYQLRDWTTDQIVYSASIISWNGGSTQSQSGDKVWWFDFSSVTTPGNYYVFDPTNNVGSYKFEINSCVYNDVLKAAVRMFYYQRCGVAKTIAHADTGFVDAACHIGMQQDMDCRLYNNTTVTTSRNLSGGWHDAGDYNKYVNFSYSTLIDLLLAYEENPSVWTDDYRIPESGNGIPDLLDEVKYELDWLIKMQGTDSSLLSVIGGGSGSPCSADVNARRYGPPTTAASLTGANVFALAAIQFNSIGQTTYANDLQTRAIKAWNWAINHPGVTFYNSGTLAAGEQEISSYEADMRKITGAIYLYALTGNANYKSYIDANISTSHLLQWTFAYPFEGPEQDGVLYYSKTPGATTSVKNQIQSAYISSLQTNNSDNLPAYINNTDAYRAHLSDNNYTWNSNQTKSKQGNMLLTMNEYNFNASNATNYTNAASGYMHYFHGVNPNSKVFLSNMRKYGAENFVKQFYHSWFENGSALWDEVDNSTYGPAPGYIPGGPNPGYDVDACCPNGCGGSANNALCLMNVTPPKGQPIQKSYKDFNDSWPLNSWTVTEAGIYTNAAYVRLLSKFCSTNCSNPIGIKSTTDNAPIVTLYPNPATQQLFVRTSFSSSHNICNLYTLTGVILESSIIKGNNAMFNIEKLVPGIYLIEIVDEQSGKQVKKFIKE